MLVAVRHDVDEVPTPPPSYSFTYQFVMVRIIIKGGTYHFTRQRRIQWLIAHYSGVWKVQLLTTASTQHSY